MIGVNKKMRGIIQRDDIKMTRNTLPKILLALMILICGLLTVNFSLLYSQENNLEVKGKIEAESLTIKGGASLPLTPVKGEVFYRSDEDTFYVFDGTAWQPVGGEGGGPDRTVATKIVAASDTDLTDRDADYVCTGTDDQNTIQQAIDDLGSNGGVVYLLEGTYNISDSIRLDSASPNDSGKAIIGTGSGTKLVTTSSIGVISADSIDDILISQLAIDGDNKTGSYGIDFQSVTNSKINKVWVENMSQHGIHLSSYSNNNIISGNNVQSNGGIGIGFIWHSSNNTILGNNVQSNSTGFWIGNSSNSNIISGNNVQLNSSNGISLNTSSNNNTVSRNNVASSSLGIYLFISSNNTILGNNVQENGEGIFVLSSSNNNTISGNNVQSSGTNGIILSSSSNNTISRNVIYDNGILSLACDGINVDDNSDNNLISSNRISDNQGPSSSYWTYMINIAAADCENNYIVGNDLTIPSDATGNLAEINDEGTNTTYTDKIKLTFEPSSSQNPGSGGMITVGASSYIPLSPSYTYTLSSTQAISDGKADGDLLILKNTSTNDITIPDNANTVLYNNASRLLNQYDTLTLIWDGSYWLEIGYSSNN